MSPPLHSNTRTRERDRERARAMAASSSSRCSSLLLFLLSLSALLLLLSSSGDATSHFKDVSLDNPTLRFAPSPCERVRVAGLSRLNLKNYPNSRRITINVSEAELTGKAEVCFHRNATIGLCRCETEDWQVMEKGQWSTVMSPYENKYIDVRFKDRAGGTITVSVEEEFQRWRLVCLGIGFVLLLFAPVVSSWAPFYYSSSMALGVLLVVLLILFQGMKLLPMGRKNVLYLTLYGSLIGVGSFIAHYFSTLVNSILVNFGLSDEMHNPVSVFLLVLVVLAGAALGYWIVRKFVLSEDGRVDAGIAQFVRWAMRVIAVVFVLQSTLDPLLAVVASCTSWVICSLITSKKWRSPGATHLTHLKNETLWLQRTRQASGGNRQAEFLSRSPRKDLMRTVRRSPNSADIGSNSLLKGPVYSTPNRKLAYEDEAYYSTFHKTPTPRRFSKKEWEDFTRDSTSEALTEWASTPEVAKWLADNANRMRVVKDGSSDDSMESSSGSSEETAVENGSGLSFFKWR